ncbi:MAG: adenylate kinase [Candidatus Dormibacteria bacterium]
MIAVFFGPPGTGKGTQAARLAATTGRPHVSTGEMLRAEVSKGSALGAEAAPIMKSGKLVPDDLMVRVIQSRLEEPDASDGVILDGFPRTVPQASALDTMLESTGREIGVVLYLDVPEAALRERILLRGQTDGRADDTSEAFTERMRVYELETAPVVDYYKNRGTRVEWIDGVGTVDEVTERILTALGDHGHNGLEAVS